MIQKRDEMAEFVDHLDRLSKGRASYRSHRGISLE